MKFWKQRIRFFLEEHPNFIGTEDLIYTPRKGLKLRFRFEGSLIIEGEYEELEINYNDEGLLVLSNNLSVYRIPWKRLICFEIVKNNENNEIIDIINMTNINKN